MYFIVTNMILNDSQMLVTHSLNTKVIDAVMNPSIRCRSLVRPWYCTQNLMIWAEIKTIPRNPKELATQDRESLAASLRKEKNILEIIEELEIKTVYST